MQRSVGLLHVALAGVIATALAFSIYYFLPLGQADTIVNWLWLLSLLLSFLFLLKGFDYNRIRFSSSLMFVVYIVAIYEVLVLLLDLKGAPKAFAAGLAPYLGVALFGALRERVSSRRRGARIGVFSSFRVAHHQLDAALWTLLLFGIVYLSIFMLLPVLLVLAYSFTPPAGGSWLDNYIAVLRSSRYIILNPIYSSWYTKITLPSGECQVILRGPNYGPVINSLIVASIVTVATTVLGTAIGFILARYTFPGHMLLRILAIVPLINAPFINSYIIKLMWSEAGPVSMLFKMFTGCSLRVESIVGVIVAQTFTLYPIVYLNAYTAFLNIDPSAEEQAENLGAKGFKLFRSVTFPLALPGIAAGSILVFVFSLEDLGAPIIFNEGNLMSYRIYSGLLTAHGTVSPEIAALSVVMLLLALLSFLAVRSYVSLRRYAMISRGGRWVSRVRRLGPVGLAIVYLVVFPLVIFTAFPQIGVVLMSLGIMKPYAGARGLEFTIPSDPFTYFNRIFMDPAISVFIRNTVVYATIAIVIAVMLAIAIAYVASRFRVGLIGSIIDSFSMAPLAIPGLVFAVGYYLFFLNLANISPDWLASALSPASPAFNAWLALVISYSIRRLPYVVRSIYAGFQQVHESLEEAALNLGASRFRALRDIVFPLLLGFIASGALIGFVYMVTEASTSMVFGGIREDQATMTYYMGRYIGGGAGAGPLVVAAMGTLLIAVQLAAVLITVFVFRQRYAFIGA